MAPISLVGLRFGSFEVLSDSGRRNNSGSVLWRCKCTECGKISAKIGATLKRGVRCSCELAKETGDRFRTHGETNSRAYRIWNVMHRRCFDAKFKDFDQYGGRGIFVCFQWHNFSTFLEDMGHPPEGHTLERIDVNGRYSPQNCRWATRKEQANNTRRNHFLCMDGARKTLAQWAEDDRTKASGVSYTLLRARIRANWPLKEAMTTRPGRRYSR